MQKFLNEKWVKTDKGFYSPLTLIKKENGVKFIYFDKVGYTSAFIELCAIVKYYIKNENSIKDLSNFYRFMQEAPDNDRKITTKNISDEIGEIRPEQIMLAMYLYQSKASAGGRGYSTSARGGSAMSCIPLGKSIHVTIDINSDLINDKNIKTVIATPRRIEIDSNNMTCRIGPGSHVRPDENHPFAVYSKKGYPISTPHIEKNLGSLGHIIENLNYNNVFIEGKLRDKAKEISFLSMVIRHSGSDSVRILNFATDIDYFARKIFGDHMFSVELYNNMKKTILDNDFCPLVARAIANDAINICEKYVSEDNDSIYRYSKFIKKINTHLVNFLDV